MVYLPQDAEDATQEILSRKAVAHQAGLVRGPQPSARRGSTGLRSHHLRARMRRTRRRGQRGGEDVSNATVRVWTCGAPISTFCCAGPAATVPADVQADAWTKRAIGCSMGMSRCASIASSGWSTSRGGDNMLRASSRRGRASACSSVSRDAYRAAPVTVPRAGPGDQLLLIGHEVDPDHREALGLVAVVASALRGRPRCSMDRSGRRTRPPWLGAEHVGERLHRRRLRGFSQPAVCHGRG